MGGQAPKQPSRLSRREQRVSSFSRDLTTVRERSRRNTATEGLEGRRAYLTVNKNLVELAALLVILVTGSGRFAGLDRFLHVLFAKRARLATA